jgi:dihydrofolate synthase/folylpolyglutamate synthase
VTPEEAERYILDRELFGMRFGLDRMRRMMTALEHPQLRFDSIHVVGTNGKSSTTRMIAEILQRHGLRTGSFLSPHLVSYNERIRIDDVDIEPQAFAAAVARAARAAELVDRSLPAGERVTQFELLTAAAYSELARREVDVAVVEAGLGGRYDATNVIPSKVQVLTSVGLEHTRWLGPTIADIATEKLDVVRDGATLVLGYGLRGDAVEVAERVATERSARIIRADQDPGMPVGAPGVFQRRNFSAAAAAARAYLGALEPAAVAAAAAEVRVPGRLQVVAQDPLTLLDGAHNPDAMNALVESLHPFVRGERPLVAVLSVLDDKDAAAMLAAIIPAAEALVFTRTRNPRALPPATLESLARQLGGPTSELLPEPAQALARARQLAGADGVVLAAGSLYLVADLLRGDRQARVSAL